MNDLEEIAQLLFHSDHFRNALKIQIRECINEENQQNSDEQVKLQCIVREVQQQIASITQYAVEQQHSHKYMSLVKKNQQFCLQIQKRMQIELQHQLSSLNQQIEEIKKQVNRTFKDIKNIPRSSNLRDQRKNITNSILQTSRYFKNNGKTKSTIDPRCMKNNNDSLLDQSKHQSQLLPINTSSYLADRSCFCSCQSDKENMSCSKQISTAVDKLKKDNVVISQQFKQLSSSLQSKIQTNLQGVWNVVSDLNSRTSKIQTTISVIDFTQNKFL